jgi:hypothetical protein
MHPPSASVNTRSMQRPRRRILSSIPYVRSAENTKAKIFTTRRGDMASFFVTTVCLPRFVASAMIGATLTDGKPASKAGLLIHFMFLKIPIQSLQAFNLIAKIRLILPNKRIPHLFARGCQIPPVIDKINPACL